MTAPFTFRDPLARALWDAWTEKRRLEAAAMPGGGISGESGQAIADELYEAMRRGGARQIGWKIGATDPIVQRRLGTDTPFSAPIFDATLLADGASLSLGELVAPLIETEIGLHVRGGQARALACIEIIDSRLPGPAVSIAEVIADFGLQRFMLFGSPCPHDGQIDVTLAHDGVPVSRATGRLDSVRDSLGLLSPEQLADGDGSGLFIAGGSLAPAIPLHPGVWRADFGPLGSLGIRVTE